MDFVLMAVKCDLRIIARNTHLEIVIQFLIRNPKLHISNVNHSPFYLPTQNIIASQIFFFWFIFSFHFQSCWRWELNEEIINVAHNNPQKKISEDKTVCDIDLFTTEMRKNLITTDKWWWLLMLFVSQQLALL